MTNCQFDIIKWLDGKDNFLILSHKNPDGDTLGSGAAFCAALRKYGKTAYILKNTEITDKYVPFVEEFFASVEYIPQYIISVDVADIDMFANHFEGNVDLCIDHHPTNPGFGNVNCICPHRAACGEIIYEIIEQMNIDIDKQIADLLYIAVSTDTGCFRYSNTTSNSLRIAAKLLDLGADYSNLNIILFRKAKSSRIALEGLIYSSMQQYHEGKVVVAMITMDMIKKSNAVEEDFEDIASLPGRIDTELVGITIREMDNGDCKISVRSVDGFDSSKLCRNFGGGGHVLAAGCTIKEKPEIAKEKILKVLDEQWMDSF